MFIAVRVIAIENKRVLSLRCLHTVILDNESVDAYFRISWMRRSRFVEEICI